MCATHSTGRKVRPPLTPIPVSGPFDHVGVDISQFPRSRNDNQYAVVFIDYLTKWPEVFAVPNQSSATIARLLVEEIVSRHWVPEEILSDRGRSFLSGLMKELETLLGFHKVNTSAYHPQTDGLVERYNRILTAMLSKTVQKTGQDWDERLPYVLFAYRASEQQSTLESPFFLLYGRDPRLPTPALLCPANAKKTLDLKEYGTELQAKMSDAWELARRNVTKAQRRQKKFYDQKSRPGRFSVGERVFLFKPAEKTGKKRKFAKPFHGPYRIVEIGENTAKVRRVDQPEEEPILVAQERLRWCPVEITDECWPPQKTKKGKRGRPRAFQSAEKQPMSTASVSEDGGGPPLMAGDIAECDDQEGDLADLPARESGTKKLEEPCSVKRANSPQTEGKVLAPNHENRTRATGKWSGCLRSHCDGSHQPEDGLTVQRVCVRACVRACFCVYVYAFV